jgi:hypothetical protein
MPADRPSRRKKQLAKRKDRRAALAQRRVEIIDDVVSGCSYLFLAQKYKISVRTVRREVDRALHYRDLDAPDRYVRLQVERLTYAIKTIDHALAQGDYHAVDPLLKVIEKLDRYHGIGRSRPADSHEAPPPRLEAAAAPLALVDARQEAAAKRGAAASSPTTAVPSPRA